MQLRGLVCIPFTLQRLLVAHQQLLQHLLPGGRLLQGLAGHGHVGFVQSQILSVLIENDPFLGRLLTGRIESGTPVPGMAIKALDEKFNDVADKLIKMADAISEGKVHDSLITELSRKNRDILELNKLLEQLADQLEQKCGSAKKSNN